MNRTIREELEQYEQDYLSPYASKSAETRGRDREEPAVISGRPISATATGFFIASHFGV